MSMLDDTAYGLYFISFILIFDLGLFFTYHTGLVHRICLILVWALGTLYIYACNLLFVDILYARCTSNAVLYDKFLNLWLIHYLYLHFRSLHINLVLPSAPYNISLRNLHGYETWSAPAAWYYHLSLYWQLNWCGSQDFFFVWHRRLLASCYFQTGNDTKQGGDERRCEGNMINNPCSAPCALCARSEGACWVASSTLSWKNTLVGFTCPHLWWEHTGNRE